jgi:hypothetical protein
MVSGEPTALRQKDLLGGHHITSCPFQLHHKRSWIPAFFNLIFDRNFHYYQIIIIIIIIIIDLFPPRAHYHSEKRWIPLTRKRARPMFCRGTSSESNRFRPNYWIGTKKKQKFKKNRTKHKTKIRQNRQLTDNHSRANCLTEFTPDIQLPPQ